MVMVMVMAVKDWVLLLLLLGRGPSDDAALVVWTAWMMFIVLFGNGISFSGLGTQNADFSDSLCKVTWIRVHSTERDVGCLAGSILVITREKVTEYAQVVSYIYHAAINTIH